MDNPLFLITKGIKAKKKRLGGGGGGGGGSGQFVQPIVDSTRANGSINGSSQPVITSSSIEVTLEDGNGVTYTDGNSNLFDALGYDDFVHTSTAQGTPIYTHNNINYDGKIDIPSVANDEDYILLIEFGTLHSTYTGSRNNPTPFTFSILEDTSNLIMNSVNELSTGNNFPFVQNAGKNLVGFGMTFDSFSNGGIAGSILLEIKAPNSTTSSYASIVAKTATAKDAYYLRINVV